jgi:hypothetical protein
MGYDEHFSVEGVETDMAMALHGKLFHAHPGDTAYNVAVAATGKKPRQKADSATVYETVICHATCKATHSPDQNSSHSRQADSAAGQFKLENTNGTYVASYLTAAVAYITSPLSITCKPVGISPGISC